MLDCVGIPFSPSNFIIVADCACRSFQHAIYDIYCHSYVQEEYRFKPRDLSNNNITYRTYTKVGPVVITPKIWHTSEKYFWYYFYIFDMDLSNARGSRTAESLSSQVSKLLARGAVNTLIYNLIACGKWVFVLSPSCSTEILQMIGSCLI